MERRLSASMMPQHNVVSNAEYSPIPVDNSVHNRFLVTVTSSQFSELRWRAAFLTTIPRGCLKRRPISDQNQGEFPETPLGFGG
jgi:hypothetical protein